MNYSALLEKLTALLERFLVAFTIWYEVRLTEKAKIAQATSEEVLDTNQLKKEVERDTKKLSDQDLANRTVIDD